MSTSTSGVGRRRWKRYPAYKDSGVAWLGEIPVHWQISAVKHAFSVRLGKMLQPLQADTGETLAPYLRAANILWNGVDVNDVREMWFSPRDKAEYALERDDLLVSEGGDVGRSAIWRGELNPCYIQNAINRVRTKGVSSTHFLYYWMYTLKAGGYIDMVCNKATIAHFTAEKVGPTQFAAPPPDEQRAIADFLDRETARIDALLAKKERLIGLLHEKRSALISQAVTRGLDPSVPLKESGVEWLGKVPAHWSTRRLKFVISRPLQYGANEPGDTIDPDLPRYIRITDIGDDGMLRDDTFRSIAEDVASPYLLREGDLLFARSGATVGKTFMYRHAWGRAAYAGYLIRATVAESVMTSPFLSYFTRSKQYWNWISSSIIQATIQNVSADRYANMVLPVPPLHEQEQISNRVDRETARIDALIAKVRESIERWREYRAALIAAAVTGEIDVREVSSSSSPGSPSSSSSSSSSSCLC